MEEVRKNKKIFYHFAIFAIVNELLIIKNPFKFCLKVHLHKTQHSGRKSQRRCDGQSEAAIVITVTSDWLLHLRCGLRSASYIDGP